MPEQSGREGLHVALEEEPHGFAGYIEPEAVADTLGEYSISTAFGEILRQVLPAQILTICEEHRPGKSLWRCLLEMVNTLMQSEVLGAVGPRSYLEFDTLNGMHDWFVAVYQNHPAEFMAIFSLDANGQKLPQNYVNPYNIGNSYMRNVFRRKFHAGPVTDFYIIPIEEWRSVMGITFFWDGLQDINNHFGPPGHAIQSDDSAMESASDEDL